jgi:hypothetical protein
VWCKRKREKNSTQMAYVAKSHQQQISTQSQAPRLIVSLCEESPSHMCVCMSVHA